MASEERGASWVSATSARAASRADNLALLILCMAQFMLVLDIAIVNVALPSIQHELGFSRDSLQLVVTMYALTFGGLLLLGGRVADVLGRRRIFLTGLAVFTLGSLACGLAVSPTMMVAARAVQGVGGALLSPAALSLLTAIFPEGQRRNRALGIWSALAAGGGAAGLILGGALTSLAGWRWVFLVNVPIGLAVMLAAERVLPEGREDAEPDTGSGSKADSIDLAGAGAITLALMAFVFGLSRGGQAGFGSPLVIALLVAAVILGAAFIRIERRVAAPLIPFAIFRQGGLAGANGATLLLSAVVLGANYFLTLYFQQVLGYSPIQTGLAFVPLTLTAALASLGVARAIGRVGARGALLAGMAALAVGSLLLTQLAPHGSYLLSVLPGMVLVAVGLGIGFTAGTLAATAGVAVRQQGVASGILGTSQQIGGAVGLAVLVTVASSTPRSTTDFTMLATTHGFDVAFATSCVMALIAALVVWAFVRGKKGNSGDVPTSPASVPAEALAGCHVQASPCLPALARIAEVRTDRVAMGTSTK